MKSLRLLAAGIFRRSRMERDMADELAAVAIDELRPYRAAAE